MCSQPSDDGAEARVRAVVVAVEDVRAFDEDLAVLGDLQLDAGQRAADRAELVVGDGRGGGRGGGLGHAVALEHRHAAGPEEFEDLFRDRRGAAGGVAHAAAEDRADVGEEALVGLVEGLLHVLGDRLAFVEHVADLDAERDRLLGFLALRGRQRLDRAVGERVDLLEHARHRGQVGRFDLLQLRDDLFGVAAEVGERAAEVEDGELDQQGEGVGEGEVEVDDLVALDLAGLADHVDDRGVVAVREHAALRRAGRAGGVDEGEGVRPA